MLFKCHVMMICMPVFIEQELVVKANSPLAFPPLLPHPYSPFSYSRMLFCCIPLSFSCTFIFSLLAPFPKHKSILFRCLACRKCADVGWMHLLKANKLCLLLTSAWSISFTLQAGFLKKACLSCPRSHLLLFSLLCT